MADEMKALRLAKKELRKSIRQTISCISEKSISSQSRAITDVILSLPEYQKASHLSVYLSMPKGEVSTDRIVKNALRAGKNVFVPFVHNIAQSMSESTSSVMDMVSLHSLEDYENLEHDSWGIPTPNEASIGGRKQCLEVLEDGHWKEKEMTDETLEMIIMPGMAFDKTLGRLGHGKGFYDFFLHRYHKKIASDDRRSRMPFLIGLALQEQVLTDDHRVPLDSTDWPLDALAVGDGTIVHRD